MPEDEDPEPDVPLPGELRPELDEPVPGDVEGEDEGGRVVEDEDGEDGAVLDGGLAGDEGEVVVDDLDELPMPEDLRSSEQPAATSARATAAAGINVPFNFMLCS